MSLFARCGLVSLFLIIQMNLSRTLQGTKAFPTIRKGEKASKENKAPFASIFWF